MTFLPQKKSLAVGLALILAAALFIILIWTGTFLPGLAGETFAKMAGIMWTPVLLDITLFLFGLSLVLWLNKYRLEKEGDEYVYLEQVEGPEIPSDLPQETRSVIYKAAPEQLGDDPTLAAIEGALAMDDQEDAINLLLRLSPEALASPPALAARITLAERQGKNEEKQKLLAELRLKSSDHPLLQK